MSKTRWQEKTVLRGDLTSLRNLPNSRGSLVVWTTTVPFTLSSVFEMCNQNSKESFDKDGTFIFIAPESTLDMNLWCVKGSKTG